MKVRASQAPARRADRRRLGTRLALGLWAAGMVAVGADLLAGHVVALPLPGREDPRLEAALEARRGCAEPDQIARLERAGFAVETLAAEALEAALGVTSVPLLALASPERELRYAGGYTERKRGPEIRDLEILADVQAGEVSEALPLFGCAVSARLARQVDPLGLRGAPGQPMSKLLSYRDGGRRSCSGSQPIERKG